jgi:class 3 adenylate cyclase/tetratricopeptide (TPR) repeat protein
MTETARKERKVVTVLFADLVGFTSRAEALDPEDVEAILRPYHQRLRAELERYGGTVEKFIGDAVMAVFGAPVAREDDPERAVRAALAIRDWATEEGGGEIRIGLATGEALVNLAARPETGEGMVAGDVVNTAARLQTAAPKNGILVGDTTYRATGDVIAYGEAAAVEAKGKAKPIPVWAALQARSRLGVDVARFHTTPLVGREHETSVLSQTLRRALHEHAPQVITIVGAPGIGKSRLVFELMQVVDDHPELIVWRQGRSLPYGGGVSFWSLSEMVKAQAGILDGDSGEVAAAKLAHAVKEAVSEDADWVLRHLRPLAGLEAEDSAEAQRLERFAAWRRFFESLAERSPVVLVFEDLHWADDGLLDFVDHLAEWATGVPLLLVGTARPELLERRPAWGGGKLNAITLALAPLSEEETARLIQSLIERPLLAADEQEALVIRAGGNPLYAEQYARMLSERGDFAKLPLPENVQGIIAARLDALSLHEKRLLQDASVLGTVFWSGSVAALDGLDNSDLEELLHGLERKDFVQRARRSSVAGSTEFSFRHVLVRDIAYGQIPRAERSDKHRLVAEWLDSLGRPEDLAEMLVHHYLQALELARAAGLETSDLLEPARRAAREAGDRALALNSFSVAARYFESALELWPSDDRDRPYVLFAYGHALRWSEDRGEAELSEARDALVEAGDGETAMEVDLLLTDLALNKGPRELARKHLEHASGLVADRGRSRARALLLGELSRFHMLGAEQQEAIRLGEEALALADELGLELLRCRVLNNVGSAKAGLGDRAGVADLERSVEIALAINSVPDIFRGYNNLAAALGRLGAPTQAILDVTEAGIRAAELLGDRVTARALYGSLPGNYFEIGDWARALRVAEEFISEVEAGAPNRQASSCYAIRAKVHLARGDLERALEDSTKMVALQREGGNPFYLAGDLAQLGRVTLAAGRDEEAAAIADEVIELAASASASRSLEFPETVLFLDALGRLDELLPHLQQMRPKTPFLTDAAIAAMAGDYSAAADGYRELGRLASEADMRLSAAERLVAIARRSEAEVQLELALAFFRSVGATRYIREAEALLAESA